MGMVSGYKYYNIHSNHRACHLEHSCLSKWGLSISMRLARNDVSESLLSVPPSHRVLLELWSPQTSDIVTLMNTSIAANAERPDVSSPDVVV